MKWKCFLIYFKKAPPAGVEPQFPGRGSSVLPLRHSASFYLWLENRAIYISRPILVSHLTNLTTHLKAPIFVMSWWLLTKKNECECQQKFALRESSNVYTGTPYSGWGQYKPLVSTPTPRINWSHSWLFELTRRHSWDQLILGVGVDTRGSYFAPIPHGVPV